MRPHTARHALVALLLILLAPPAFAVGPDAALYRVAPAKRALLDRFLSRGIDVAGTGEDGSLHVIIDPVDVDAARAMGLALTLLDPRGPQAAPSTPFANPNLGDYHTLAETMAEMAAYAATHPSIARLDTIGTTVESRPIVAMKISDNVAVDEDEPEVLLVGCHHARELMSVELPLYVMRRLLDGYGVDPILTDVVDGRETWIVPILNADGHVYVQGHSGGQPSSWWRKNRRDNGDGTVGVDLNRNYGYNWGYDDFGSSPLPSSETYRGPGAFSEPESDAVRALSAARNFRLAVSFHSYGELVLFPWGYARLDTPDHRVYRALGDSVSAQNGYAAGNPNSNTIYLTNGDMDDWVYGDVATKSRMYGFTFELNSLAQGGFHPNDNLIPATCEKNWGPVLTLLRYADDPRRAIAPARPAAPSFLAEGTASRLDWANTVIDPSNPPARHDVRRMDAAIRIVDDAEAGVADWDSTLFAWSTARSTSGARAYWSGSGDHRVSVLSARASVSVGAAESLVVNAFWDLEPFYDYWYAEASSDGGETWFSLPGDRTTNYDPFGANEGSGISGTSGGGFLRAAFSLGALAGAQASIRFRCVTDGVTHGEGLYLDDISPTGRYVGASVLDTGSPAPFLVYDPAPADVGEYQVRAVDGEGHRGPWSDRTAYQPGITAVSLLPSPPARDGFLSVAPNPFNPAVTIRYRLEPGGRGSFRVTVFDMTGRLVATLAEGAEDGAAEVRTARWDGLDRAGRAVASGVYLLRLETVRGVAARKLTLLR
jgi:hypothetical protein